MRVYRDCFVSIWVSTSAIGDAAVDAGVNEMLLSMLLLFREMQFEVVILRAGY